MDMITIRKRRHRRVLLQIRVEHTLLAVVLCLFMVWVGWEFTGSANESVALCADAYARARTAADTLAVDGRAAGGRGLPASCGGMRRDGTLDGHRQAAEVRRAARSGTRDPLIEK